MWITRELTQVLNEVFCFRYDNDEDEEEIDDPRLRRLRANKYDDTTDDRMERHRRHVQKPERVESSSESSDDEVYETQPQLDENDQKTRRISICSESESDTELSDTEIERRRQMLKNKMLQQKKEEEVLVKEDEGKSESSEDESSEYEEESESEEDNEPRIKPQFVRKKDRTTIIEKEKDLIKQKQLEHEAKKAAKDRRRHTLRMVEDSIKRFRKSESRKRSTYK